MAAMARHEHKESPREIITAYLLLFIAVLLLLGAAYGLWLLLARIT